MGGSQVKIQSNTVSSSQYDLKIIPSKALYSPEEDITGQVVLDVKRHYMRPGIMVISLDGKE